MAVILQSGKMKRREVLQVVAVVLLQFVGLLQQPKVLAQVTDVGGDPEGSTFGRKEYSDLFGSRLGPDEA